MSWNSSFYKKLVYPGICILLCIAILTGLLLSAADMVYSQPDNPLDNEAIREISVLKVGEDTGELDNIVVPEGDSVTPTEPEETEPEETEPEETEPEDTDPEETEPEETEPEDTEPEDTEPEDTEPEDTEPEETEPEETKPEETKPEDTTPEQTDPTTPNEGDEDEGNDDGNEGEEGSEELELDLAAVMTWYKYGTDPKTVACGPSSSVTTTINTAQLMNSTLKYAFELTGTDAKYVQIASVSLAEGDSAMTEVAQSGTTGIQLPEGTATRNYTFQVNAVMEKPDEDGEVISQDLTFTFVLVCEHNLDLDLELTWQPNGENVRSVICGPDHTEAFTVNNYDLTERVFQYTVRLTGSLAEEAQITEASYTTLSGQKSGSLAMDSGSLILDPAPGSDQETYLLTFTVHTGERDVLYHYQLTYKETLDVQLSFRWLENGTVSRSKTCQPDDSASVYIKNNQLSAGALPYELELTGADSADGRILSVSYTSEAGDSDNLETSGSLPVSMPEGASSNTYRITVSALVKGQRMTFEILVYCAADVSLQMEYTVQEDGASVTRQIICENTRSKTAEAIYDDQLTDGILDYTMTLVGAEDSGASIVSVICYQSGSGRSVTVSSDGQTELLLNNGKTGENTFEITAEDTQGSTYRFTINIPYKHRGENNIKITANLTDGQTIINKTKTNLTVQAWSEDENGSVISYIPANGTDTKLIVQLDGETLHYVSSSGAISEYDLYPANPEVGDTNTHKLYIYAEDALGNYGKLELTLNGQRRDAGQSIGKATIYVDMSVLGLGVVANIPYDVLADEPISYVIAKAVMGKDTGDPFGAASQTLGWSGRYAGTLDDGFYLQSLTTGHNANALDGSSWPGATEEEVLAAIDARFGAGTGLATLWRCLYRNGLNKSSGSGNSFGEFDYTSGSGWMYSVGGATYYPGQSMSSVYLRDGDVLTLRYTLAYGWDVGGGTPGYGSTVGYCVSAVNGSFRINHQMETIQNADGSVTHACRCCGIVEDCVHENITCIDQEDGTHIQYCEDCKKTIGDPEDHIWVYGENETEEQHICSECGAAENHNWEEVEGSNTATCVDPGTRKVQCVVCNHVREEEVGPKGHTLDNRWQSTKDGHYEKCSTCGEEVNHGAHQYKPFTYTENGVQKEDYECEICHALHIDECAGSLTEKTATCQKITYHCGSCGHDMYKEGSFEEYHHYTDGKCEYCGAPDPNGSEPTDPEPTEPKPTEPEPTDPEPTDPEPTDPPATDPPVTDSPATDPPVTDPPATDPPATDPPAEEPEGDAT